MAGSLEPIQPFRPLSPAEDADLRASIVADGVLTPVLLDQHGRTLDGHHRQRISAELDVDCPTDVFVVRDEAHARQVAVALNTARRHLTAVERRQAVGALTDAGMSQAQISRQTKIPRRTVDRDQKGTVRAAHPAESSDTPKQTRDREAPPGTESDRVEGADGKSYPARLPPQEFALTIRPTRVEILTAIAGSDGPRRLRIAAEIDRAARSLDALAKQIRRDHANAQPVKPVSRMGRR